MPIYEYKCLKCGKITEEITTKIHDNTTIMCVCGEPALRVPVLGNFVLSGECWSKDGYSKRKINGVTNVPK